MKKFLCFVVACICLCSVNVFASDELINRENFCTRVYSCLKYTGCFDDVEIKDMFKDSDAKAVNLFGTIGIVNGVSEGIFNPDSYITREEAATIFARFCSYLELPASLSEFEYSDDSLISSWAKDSVYKVYHAGIMTGTEKDVFSPSEGFTQGMTDICAKRIFDSYTEANLPKEEGSFEIAIDESFTDKIYNEVDADYNYMISPFSIKTALMMAANGADGSTRDQILDALEVNDINEYNEQISELMKQYTDTDAIVLDVANSIWFNKDLLPGVSGFKDSYVSEMNKWYDAEAKTVNNKDAVERINSWVEEKTRGKIPSIISDSNFVAVLANAVYFKANWANPFMESKTHQDVFYNIDGSETNAEFMSATNHYMYAETDSTKILRMPYSSYDVQRDKRSEFQCAMYIILSEDKVVSPDKLIEYADLQRIKVNVTMPKFEMEYSNSLVPVLKKFGIAEAFDYNKADFGSMCDSKGIYIQDVAHKTYIKVDEKGTEAAAVTAILAGATSSPRPEEIVYLKIDRPFTYVIKDETNNEVLFVGKVTTLEN